LPGMYRCSVRHLKRQDARRQWNNNHAAAAQTAPGPTSSPFTERAGAASSLQNLCRRLLPISLTTHTCMCLATTRARSHTRVRLHTAPRTYPYRGAIGPQQRAYAIHKEGQQKLSP